VKQNTTARKTSCRFENADAGNHKWQNSDWRERATIRYYYFHSVLKARQIGRPRRRGEDNIKMDLQEGWVGMDWIDLAEDRDRWPAVVNAVMNVRVP
jgi:hypothetical protein